MNNHKNEEVKPFLKWAGGKRWFVANFPDLLKIDFERYIEPFLGSGAVFFKIQPQKALLSDLNSELITTYQAIKNDHKKVKKILEDHNSNHSKKYYYHVRQQISLDIYKTAARLIYLNRTCWNGLYRVNKNGEFNVPIGTKTNVIMESDNFADIADLLSRATLNNEDFEAVIDRAGKDDFIFVDPPYTVCHNNNGFLKYNERIFSWADQLRLKGSLFRARKRGAKILLLNANHFEIAKMYNDFGNLEVATRSSILSGKPEYRKKIDELIIRNY
ncbi:MAG: Dam family site-specific DNA-(adenine-N6)-methyltransferase [Candidatus Saganbacteria bacterium]|nr:Dam family site-specific DNA-(adenine-N6)-methyltransferase [Candidatus Saganbacteria bacterium]